MSDSEIPTGAEPVIDDGRLASLRRAMTAPAFDRVVATFLEMLEAQVGELGRARDSGDHVAALQVAHRLKGATTNFGAARLGARAAALEEAIEDSAAWNPLVEVVTETARETAASLSRRIGRRDDGG